MHLPVLFREPGSSASRHQMPSNRVLITRDRRTPREVDRWVREDRSPNRSTAFQTALGEMLARRKRRRLVEELGQLNPRQERTLAEESFLAESAWPED